MDSWYGDRPKVPDVVPEIPMRDADKEIYEGQSVQRLSSKGKRENTIKYADGEEDKEMRRRR